MHRIEKIELSTYFPIGPVNSYLVFGEKLTLIDAGLKYDVAWKELNDGLTKLGLTVANIEQIIITHHHNDHVGLLPWILEKNPNITVLSHKDTETQLQDPDYLSWSGEFFENLFLEFGLPKEMAITWAYRKRNRDTIPGLKINNVLQEGDEVPGLSGWKVIETQGHSQDHISLYHPDEEIFICGDFIIKGLHVGIFLDAPMRGKKREKPLLQYLTSLEKVKKMPIKITYSGHGPDIVDIGEAIKAQEDNIENRIRRTMNSMKKWNRPCTGFEIIKDMYADRYEKAVITFVFEIIGVLDLLSQRGKITIEKVKGVNYYSLIDFEI